MGLYPNVCYHKDKRKVLTYDHKSALVHKSSVNCDSRSITFPSPFFVFGEKVAFRFVIAISEDQNLKDINLICNIPVYNRVGESCFDC